MIFKLTKKKQTLYLFALLPGYPMCYAIIIMQYYHYLFVPRMKENLQLNMKICPFDDGTRVGETFDIT